MNWSDIPEFPNIHYSVHVPWAHLEEQLEHYNESSRKGVPGLDLNPDFQRGHIWTEQQQIRYVEFAIRQPQSGMHIYFNHPGWMSDWSKGPLVLVDGKQRLEAARRFIRGEIPVFGHYVKEFTHYSPGNPIRHLPADSIPNDITFIFNIAKLQTRADVLQWYLDFNAGGTPHTQEEIDRVRGLLKKEKS